MKNFIVEFGKVEIHLSTFLFLFFSFICGRFISFFSLFILAFIHELFHFLAAYFLKIKVYSISILPFGFSLKSEPLINTEWYKELLIVIMGPLSYFFSLFLIEIAYKLNLISLVGLENIKQVNLFILCFNLIPIYPLDGGKIIKIILGFFLTEKKCMLVVGMISLISLIVYIILLPIQFTIYIFLIYSQSEYWYYFKYNYMIFLVSRLKNFKHKIKVHNKNDLYRNYENYIQKNNSILTEEEFIKFNQIY